MGDSGGSSEDQMLIETYTVKIVLLKFQIEMRILLGNALEVICVGKELDNFEKGWVSR
jgi:hypothetical protein